MSSKTDSLKKKVTDALKNDPSIILSSLLVSVVKKGSFFSPSFEVQLSGRVEKEGDIDKIRKIAEDVSGDIPVVSTLRFKS